MKNLSIFCLLLVATLSAYSQSVWTVSDVVNQEYLGEAVFSPDGNAIAWTKRRPSKAKDTHVTDIYLTRLNGPGGTFRETRLTTTEDSDRNLVFSANGETLYFLSSRKGGDNLWSISLWGGEPVVVDSFPNGISSLRRLNDSTLTFLAEEPASLAENLAEKRKDDTEAVEDSTEFKPVRVFAYHLHSKTTTRLTLGRYPVTDYAVSPNGRWMVTEHTMSPHYGIDGKPAPTFYLWDLEKKTNRQMLQGYQEPGNFRFAKDNNGFFFSSVRSSDPEWKGSGITLIHHFDIATAKIESVGEEWAFGLGTDFSVTPEGIVANMAAGPYNELVRYQRAGGNWKPVPIEAGEFNRHVDLLTVSNDGKKALYAWSTAGTPTEYRLAELGENRIGKGEIVLKLNPSFSKKPKVRSEVVYWKGALKEQVNGILTYPANYDPARKYPIVVAIHGGPSAADLDEWGISWAYYPAILAQKGAFVLQPNYHGSSNHGLKFVESIKGHYYELEVPDILNGIDSLIRAGRVHPDSQAVMGWSNGAILATGLILAEPNRFKVAATGAGDVNWTSDYGTCEFGVTFDQSYFGGAPWDDTDKKTPYNVRYIQKSPLFELEKVVTPLIIFHGSEDRAVPRDQSHEYYRAMQQIGKAPVRFLWFPGEQHGFRKLTHQTRKMEEEIAWIDTYLWGKKPEKEVVAKESPLFAAIEKSKIPKQGPLWGVKKGEYLVPEVVSLGKDTISAGRFEVTQAQFRAFQPGRTFEYPDDNAPATGITLEEAKAYVTWLSKITGETYRLPDADEAESWQELAVEEADEENTLNFWAGYDLSPEAAVAVRQKALSVPLFKEVGEHPPVKTGKADLYDLGGNAAEWFSDGEKSGTYGFSAYDHADPASPVSKSELRHTGFRVVKP